MTEQNYGAQNAYRRDEVAQKYDQLRFSSLRGQIGHWLDCRAVSGLLRGRLTPRARVLDLPCGTGRLLGVLGKEYQVVGVDISWEMIIKCIA